MQDDVILKIYRSDGEQFVIDNNDWIIPSNGLEGIDWAGLDIYTSEQAIGDGAIITGQTVPARNILITCMNTDVSKNAEMRNTALRFFNPIYTYKLYVTYQKRTLWINCKINQIACPSHNIYKKLELKIGFICANPYFLSVDNFNKDLASISGGFGFPYIDTDKIDANFGVFNFEKTVNLVNDGDIDTTFKATITFDGEVENPTLIQDDLKFEILGTYNVDDKIVVDFVNKKITINGKSATTKVSADSTFTGIKIAVGGSNLSFTATRNEEFIHCKIVYNQMYGGM